MVSPNRPKQPRKFVKAWSKADGIAVGANATEPLNHEDGPFLAPSTASLSASTFPGLLACPLIHSNVV